MRIIIFLLTILLLNTPEAMSQSSYSGYLGKFPITLVTHAYTNTDVVAYYVYDAYDTPILLDTNIKNQTLQLLEKNTDGEITGSLNFPNFKADGDGLLGFWMNADSTKNYPISLKKDLEIRHGNHSEWKAIDLLQASSTQDHYFKIIVSKSLDDYYARVSGLKILEKGTDQLVQTLDISCQLLGWNNVDIGDYNFDGITDFSVFEASYAGPNTSSIYFLYDPTTEKYFESGFAGVSLQFDSETKRIHERNQCCAGTSVIEREYKVENNQMVLVEEHCYQWDNKERDLVERPMNECY